MLNIEKMLKRIFFMKNLIFDVSQKRKKNHERIIKQFMSISLSLVELPKIFPRTHMLFSARENFSE